MSYLYVRDDFCKCIKSGESISPISPLEINYALAFKFKREHKKSSKFAKIEDLKHLALIKIKGNPRSYFARRKKTHASTKHCFVCKYNKAFCQHHIILLKNGGYDTGINRIPICKSCHSEIHSWMKQRRNKNAL